VLSGCRLLHPKQPLYVILSYLGFIAFFLGRVYELSRLFLDLELYNTFDLGFVGIIGAFSFWLSSNSSITLKGNKKAKKKDVVKCVLASFSVFSIYFLILSGTVSRLERVIDFTVTVFSAASVYFCLRLLLLRKEDDTNALNDLKMFNIGGVCFSMLIELLALAFAFDINSLIFGTSVLLSIDLIFMLIALKKTAEEWK
jgi:hypothetical protein